MYGPGVIGLMNVESVPVEEVQELGLNNQNNSHYQCTLCKIKGNAEKMYAHLIGQDHVLRYIAGKMNKI